MPVQFARYFANAAQFQVRNSSYQFRQPVANLLMERMWATLELATCATILAMVFGILMGVSDSALKRDTFLAKVLQAVSLIGISLPTFLIGILRSICSPPLGWLPSFSGAAKVVHLGWWTTGLLTVSGLKALIMPSITLGLFQMTLIMRLVRAEMLEVLRTDYIRFGAGARVDTDAGRTFRSRAQEYACPGDHRRGLAVWLGYCICDHYRNRIPAAGHGTVVRASGAERRYSDHGGLFADEFP